MEFCYAAPRIRVVEINVNTVLCGSDDPPLSSTSHEGFEEDTFIFE